MNLGSENTVKGTPCSPASADKDWANTLHKTLSSVLVSLMQMDPARTWDLTAWYAENKQDWTLKSLIAGS